MSEKDPYLDNSDLLLIAVFLILLFTTLTIVAVIGRSSEEYSRDHNPCVCKGTP